jgi:hypothetical protein
MTSSSRPISTSTLTSACACYNSGLFDFRKDTVRKTGTVPDCGRVRAAGDCPEFSYPPKSPYEFSVIGIEILGEVYEQFLGKVIRLTAGHQAKVEEKPEVRKAGGVHYTPQYIVSYIVKNTVGRLLEVKSPADVRKFRIPPARRRRRRPVSIRYD